MNDFTENYSLLFFSLVFLCFGYGILLVFYVNDKISEIDKAHHIKSRQVSEADRKKISDDTNMAKATLGKYCKKLMMIFLAAVLVFNTISIIVKDYNNIYGYIGAYAFPIIAYFVFVFFLLIAMGLKGASILRTGQFFKGLNN
jgi:hypothetical protein